jgi:ubiquinone biosynthesis protein UbiJ
VQSNAQDVSALRKQVESLQAEVDKLKKASSARKK